MLLFVCYWKLPACLPSELKRTLSVAPVESRIPTVRSSLSPSFCMRIENAVSKSRAPAPSPSFLHCRRLRHNLRTLIPTHPTYANKAYGAGGAPRFVHSAIQTHGELENGKRISQSEQTVRQLFRVSQM